MRKHIRFSLLILLVVFVCGSYSSPAAAGHSGQQIIKMIKNNPCGTLTLKPGGAYSFPQVTCEGYKGKSATIRIPIREWDISPEYPFVHMPFFLGIGSYPGSAGLDFDSEGTIKWPGKVKITNYKTEVRLVPYGVTGNFNGAISGDSSMGFHGGLLEELKPGYARLDSLDVSSISDIKSSYYVPGGDTAILVLLSRKSSYHAENPSTYKGEPAYRLEVTSHYVVEAKASWDHYRFWEWKLVGEETVCIPGTNSQGLYECFLKPGDINWRGHYTTQPIYDWVWGDKREENGETGWVPIHTVSTHLVRWPDGKNHDHIPILVYQSQPLLQKP